MLLWCPNCKQNVDAKKPPIDTNEGFGAALLLVVPLCLCLVSGTGTAIAVAVLMWAAFAVWVVRYARRPPPCPKCSAPLPPSDYPPRYD